MKEEKEWIGREWCAGYFCGPGEGEDNLDSLMAVKVRSRHIFYRWESMPSLQIHNKLTHLISSLTILTQNISIASINSSSLLFSKKTGHSTCTLAALASASNLHYVFTHPYLYLFLLRVRYKPPFFWPPDLHTHCSFCKNTLSVGPSSLSSEPFFQKSSLILSKDLS